MVILCGDIVGYVLNVQFSVILYRRVDAPVRLFAVGKRGIQFKHFRKHLFGKLLDIGKIELYALLRGEHGNAVPLRLIQDGNDIRPHAAERLFEIGERRFHARKRFLLALFNGKRLPCLGVL